MEMVEAVRRICTRLACQEARVNPLQRGGVRVDLTDPQDAESWMKRHQLVHELQLVGWGLDVDSSRLLVLGWSAIWLERRIRVLLECMRRLQDTTATAALAVAVTDRIYHRHPYLNRDQLTTATVTYMRSEHLRWPVRLAELDGLERTDRGAALRRLLAASLRAEQQVHRLCEWHLQVSTEASRAMWEQVNTHGRHGRKARMSALDHVRRHSPVMMATSLQQECA